jgi:hypothetical protein
MSNNTLDEETNIVHSFLDTDTVVHVCNREVFQGYATDSRYFRFLGPTPSRT